MATVVRNVWVGRAAPGSHTFSNTWISANEQEHERYKRVEVNLHRLFPRSEVIPKTFNEWLEHRISMMQVRVQEASSMVVHHERMRSGEMTVIGPCRLNHSDDRGAVLSMHTIWCKQPEVAGGRVTAAWPSQQELKWEGDDRAKNNFGRFLPLPREAGNPTVAWHHSQMVRAHDFDQVRPVPTAEDIAWAATVNLETREDLVLSSLWDAIDGES